ncbi:MAG: tRNA lysidine(34) synthetase TilS [Legionella sp.]|nr:tRNA lysidine(34) synthetase TilS [Legionella sp.]
MTKELVDAIWIANLDKYNQIIVGFSGGLDSTVLLHALAATCLKKKILAVHINHGISPNAHIWQQHCEQFCIEEGVRFLAQEVQFNRSSNIEEGARLARHAVFSSLLHTTDCVVLAHHRDDQAETVLLQLFRGAGIDGLAAMPEQSTLEPGVLLRPFLIHSRKVLEQYALKHQLKWVEDESNNQLDYSRNYLRHQIIPLILNQWPGAKSSITRTAVHCQQARRNLDALAQQDLKELTTAENNLNLLPLVSLNEDRIINILRLWLRVRKVKLPSTKTLQRIIHEMIHASQDAQPIVSWGSIRIRRHKQHLYIEKMQPSDLLESIVWQNFPAPLILDNSRTLTAKKGKEGLNIPPGAIIEIRFRTGGERITLHGQNKKLKKLFQEWDIPTWLRDKVPLIYLDNRLAAVGGFAASDCFFTKDSSTAWIISVLNPEI